MVKNRVIKTVTTPALAISSLVFIALAACGGSADSTATPTATPVTTPGSTQTSATPTGTASRSTEDGDLAFLVGDGSKATFTVTEQLANLPAPNDAVLETDALSGNVYLDGREFVVTIDLHQLESDQSRRDQFVRSQLFPTQRTATVTFPGISDLPAGLLDGDEVNTTATGAVNVNGVDAEIPFEIQARLDDDVLYVLGRADFTWADFGMNAPKSSTFDVEDDVHVEVLLSTTRSA